MKAWIKGAIAAALIAGGSVAVSAPASAQSSFGVWVGDGPRYGGYGYGYRDGYYRDYPRYRRDRHYRGYRDYRGYRYRGSYRGYRQRCWREWRYDPWRDRDVRVRICR